jgi:hypothetical protein
MNAWLLFASFTLCVAGCSSSSDGATPAGPSNASAGKAVPPGPCDQQHCNVEGIFTCFEWSTNDAAGSSQQKEICDGMGGVVGSGACPKDKQVAGCREALAGATDGCSVTWGYPPIAADNVKSDCTDRGGVLVNP